MTLLPQFLRDASRREIVGWILATSLLAGLDQLGLYFLDAGDTPSSPLIPDSLPLAFLGFSAEFFVTFPLMLIKSLGQSAFGIGADFFMSNSNNAIFDFVFSAVAAAVYLLCRTAFKVKRPSAC